MFFFENLIFYGAFAGNTAWIDYFYLHFSEFESKLFGIGLKFEIGLELKLELGAKKLINQKQFLINLIGFPGLINVVVDCKAYSTEKIIMDSLFFLNFVAIFLVT